MTTRIFLKLILTFVGLLAIAAVGLDYLVTGVTEKNFRQDLERDLLARARLAESVLRHLPAGQYGAAVEEIAERAGARVTVIRPDGTVVADSDANPDAMENHASRPEFVEALSGRVGMSSRQSATIGIELLYVAIPTEQGALRLALPVPEIDARTREIRSRIIEVTVLALFPTIFLAAWLARNVSGRLSRIIAFSEKLAEGNLQAEPPPSAGGELGELERSLETTGQRLRFMFEQLQEERSRFEAAVNGLGEGILVVDREGRTLLSNPVMAKMFPDQRVEEGAPLSAWTHEEIPELFGRVFQDGVRHEVDFRVSRPVERAWKVSCAPIFGPLQKLQAAVAVFYDITELQKVDRMRRDFVINVSHELRTPLTAIQGYTETLLDGAMDEPEISRRFLGIIRQNAERLAQLTSDLMTLSQIEVNAREFSFLPHSVVELLAEATDAIRAMTEKKQLSVNIATGSNDLQVECDSDAIHQVLMNLLENAAKYTADRGEITVGAEQAGDEVRFFVRDTGSGIPAEHIPRLFERFYRVDKARSRALGGTGLGLAIVKHLVLAHRGSVWVESEVGVGSAFYFQIPAKFAPHKEVVDSRQGVLF